MEDLIKLFISTLLEPSKAKMMILADEVDSINNDRLLTDVDTCLRNHANTGCGRDPLIRQCSAMYWLYHVFTRHYPELWNAALKDANIRLLDSNRRLFIVNFK